MAGEVQVEYLGANTPDYFQGYGTAFTEYEFCTTGVGSNLNEALDDALESVAQNETYLRPVPTALNDAVEEFKGSHNMTRFVCAGGLGCCEQINDGECVESDHDECDMQLYVGIRWTPA